MSPAATGRGGKGIAAGDFLTAGRRRSSKDTATKPGSTDQPTSA
jgi:hypothetical protein